MEVTRPQRSDRPTALNTPLFLVIEGADCTGKTTLSIKLAKQLGAFVFHATADGKLKDCMYDYQKSIIVNAETNLLCGHPVILDRHWPSEAVYGPIFRPGKVWNPDDFIHRMRRLNAIYIFCDRVDVLAAHARQQDSEHPYDAAQFERVVLSYRSLFANLENSKFPVFRYDVNEHGGYTVYDIVSLLMVKQHELLDRTNSK